MTGVFYNLCQCICVRFNRQVFVRTKITEYTHLSDKKKYYQIDYFCAACRAYRRHSSAVLFCFFVRQKLGDFLFLGVECAQIKFAVFTLLDQITLQWLPRGLLFSNVSRRQIMGQVVRLFHLTNWECRALMFSITWLVEAGRISFQYMNTSVESRKKALRLNIRT